MKYRFPIKNIRDKYGLIAAELEAVLDKFPSAIVTETYNNYERQIFLKYKVNKKASECDSWEIKQRPYSNELNLNRYFSVEYSFNDDEYEVEVFPVRDRTENLLRVDPEGRKLIFTGKGPTYKKASEKFKRYYVESIISFISDSSKNKLIFDSSTLPKHLLHIKKLLNLL